MRVLFESTRHPKAFHSPAIVFCADMTLGAVLRNDVGETGGHDEDGQASSGAPVEVDAVGSVVCVGLEVDEASVLGPYASKAVAGLVSPKGSAKVSISTFHEGRKTD